MTTRNPYREAVEDELSRWPDVFYEFDGSASKHDKVVLYRGMNVRVHHFSRGSSAGRGSSRATANCVSDLRKVIREMTDEHE